MRPARALPRKGRWLASAIVACVCLVLAGPAAGVAARSQAVTVSLDQSRPGAPVPGDFIGLSYEVKDLPMIAALADRGNLVTLLRSLGVGVLRFGGVTADSQVAWVDPAGDPRPKWATASLGPPDLRNLARLARSTGWRVVLTLNLAHYDPAAAADEATVAHVVLGASLKAVEIGNEPTAYVHEHLRDRFSFAAYRHQIEVYRAVIEAAAPGLPIVGPDLEPLASNPSNLRWARAEAREVRPRLLTGHLYGASKCASIAPTRKLLLSAQVHHSEEVALRQLRGVSSAYGMPAWLDETNDISCGGQAGVSDSYASALWAVDLLTRTLRAPFVGDAFHGSLREPTGYSPISALTPADLTRGDLVARPKWYALLLAHEVEGDRPFAVKIDKPGLDLAVWAGRTPRGELQVIVDDEQPPGSRPLVMRLRDHGSHGSALILGLNRTRIDATSGVTLGGSAVAPDGSWNSRSTLRAKASRGFLTVSVKPASSLLITMRP